MKTIKVGFRGHKSIEKPKKTPINQSFPPIEKHGKVVCSLIGDSTKNKFRPNGLEGKNKSRTSAKIRGE